VGPGIWRQWLSYISEGVTGAKRRLELAQGRTDFGDPDMFFVTARVPDSRWVSFTVPQLGLNSSNGCLS
jgi:hypothetical protein